jgi:hypothetical protein
VLSLEGQVAKVADADGGRRFNVVRGTDRALRSRTFDPLVGLLDGAKSMEAC